MMVMYVAKALVNEKYGNTVSAEMFCAVWIISLEGYSS